MACNASARSTIDTCSPVEAITSISRGFGSGFNSRARPIRRLVSPAIAEGTTTSWWPSLTKRAMRRATSRMRSGLPMEVPPYFWTIRDTGEGKRGKAAILSWHPPKQRMKTYLRPQNVALVALACGVAATLFAWFLAGRQVERAASPEFAAQANLATNILERRIQRYVDVLYGLEALAYHDVQLARPEFAHYVAALELGKRFPGVTAVEFIHRVPHAQREAFVDGVRSDRTLSPDGYPKVDIQPPGQRPAHWAIEYTEPMDPASPVFGLDNREPPPALEAATRPPDTCTPAASCAQ